MTSRVAQIRRLVMIALFFIGALFVLAAVVVEVMDFGLTPGFGVLQTLALLLGVTALTIAVYLFLSRLRPAGTPRSLQADIGLRLSLTGLVLCYVAGFADLIRIGTHVQPEFRRPFIGPLQWGGLVFGLLAVLAGMLLYYTARGERPASSLGFLLDSQHE